MDWVWGWRKKTQNKDILTVSTIKKKKRIVSTINNWVDYGTTITMAGANIPLLFFWDNPNLHFYALKCSTYTKWYGWHGFRGSGGGS